jgi:hypothetical protein
VEIQPHKQRSLEEFDFARPRLIRRLRREQALLRVLLPALEVVRLRRLWFLLGPVGVCAGVGSLSEFEPGLALVTTGGLPGLLIAVFLLPEAVHRRRQTLTHEITRLEREHEALTGKPVESE